MFRAAVVVCLFILLPSLASAGGGSFSGNARFERVKGNLVKGFLELYEYKAFLSPDGEGTGYSYHCGDPGTALKPYSGNYFFKDVPAGRYSLMTSFGEFFPRGTVQSGLVVRDGERTVQDAPEAIDYSGYLSKSAWDPTGSETVYQTFIATGTSISRIAFAKADSNREGRIAISVHRDDGGAVETWPQVGEVRETQRYGYGADHWVAWNAGDVSTIPGKRYAIRLRSIGGKAIQPYWCEDDLYPDGSGFRGGESAPAKHDYYIAVFSDNDDTIATLQIRSHGYGTLADERSHAAWAQSFSARGTSLAGSALFATTGGASGWKYSVDVSIHKGAPDGPCIGPNKTMPCAYAPFVGVAGVCYSRDEIPTIAGQTYWIVYRKSDGGEFNASRMNEEDVYPGGTGAYFDKTWRPQKYDLFMNVYEYDCTR